MLSVPVFGLKMVKPAPTCSHVCLRTGALVRLVPSPLAPRSSHWHRHLQPVFYMEMELQQEPKQESGSCFVWTCQSFSSASKHGACFNHWSRFQFSREDFSPKPRIILLMLSQGLIVEELSRLLSVGLVLPPLSFFSFFSSVWLLWFLFFWNRQKGPSTMSVLWENPSTQQKKTTHKQDQTVGAQIQTGSKNA